MRIALASDHAGYAEKERLKTVLTELGVEFNDLGTGSEESVDYPDYARKVAEQVADGRVEQGLLVCGSGTGMAITANKVPCARRGRVVRRDRPTRPPAQQCQRAGDRRPHNSARRHSKHRARVVCHRFRRRPPRSACRKDQ